MEEELKRDTVLEVEEKNERYANLSVSSFILSMIGLIAMPTLVGLLVFGILAFIKGKKVSSEYKKAPYRALADLGKGFGLFEIILACVAIVILLIYLFILLIAFLATLGSAMS